MSGDGFHGSLFSAGGTLAGFDLEASHRLPSKLHFGTSSWTYPGWKGLVYHRDYSSDRDFRGRCLEEYGQFPWFRAVGIDSTFYAPARTDTLDRYARQLPEGFLWLSKVWERVTVPRFGRHPRYGVLAGKDNPEFLDPVLFRDAVLPAFDRPGIRERTGPFLFQFQSLGNRATTHSEEFLRRLEGFLQAIPTTFRYAIELRSPELLQPRYFQMLNHVGATHCFNHWGGMPPLIEQMRMAADAGGLTADFYVARLLTPLGVDYAESVTRFQPFDKLVAEQPRMRQDVVRLAMRALERDAEAFVLVNNRTEGNSPTTIDAIGRMILEALEA